VILLLALVGVPLLLWVYWIASKGARAPDPEGARVIAVGRNWHHKYGLPPAWALALARGSRVTNQTVLCLAFALPAGALSATYPTEDKYFWAFLILLFLAFFGLPLLAALVGFTGRPRSWLRSGSDAVSADDL
jgi:hypothetical protein